MKDVIIVSGGNIQRDFALDFLKKNKKSVDKEIKLMYNKNRSARAKQKSTLKSKQ